MQGASNRTLLYELCPQVFWPMRLFSIRFLSAPLLFRQSPKGPPGLKINDAKSSHHFQIFGNVRPFILHSSVPKNEFAVFPYIVRKRVPTPPFLRQPPLDPACPPFLKSLFLLPSFLFHPLLRHFRQFPPPSRNALLP